MITLAAIFIILSAFVYGLHYLIFRDVHHIFIYMVGDLAFLPLEVFLVVVLLERILTRRETRAKLQKLNMVVGAFFSEVGNHLLKSLLEHFNNNISSKVFLNTLTIRKKSLHISTLCIPGQRKIFRKLSVLPIICQLT